MRYLASRLAIVASLLFLIAWIGSALLATIGLAAGDYALGASLTRPAWTIDVPLFGFLGLMIFGLAEHFLPLFAGRELRRPRLATVQIAVAIASVLLSIGFGRSLFVGRLVWFAACALFVGMLIESLRSGRIVPRPGNHAEGRREIDRRAAAMTYVACGYLLVAAAGLALAAPGARVLVPSLAGYGSSFLHLYTLGFVSLSLFGLVLHLVPRFLETSPSAQWVTVLAGLGILSPAGVALLLPYAGIDDSRRLLLVGFVFLEEIAALLFASLVLGLWRRTTRHRPSAVFSVLGGVWLVVGVAFGLYMAIVPGPVAGWASAHGWISLLGFAGFEVFGITHEILLPYVTRGERAWRRGVRAHQGLASIGIVLVVLSSALAAAGFPRSSWVLAIAGFALLIGMALSYAAGTFGTLRAISRPSGAGWTGR